MSADHPLATAAARAGGGTDVILSADALGRRVDARITALSDLTESTDAARDEIRAALAEFCRAAATVSGGEDNGFLAWERSQIATIRDCAERLFAGEDWLVDVRGSRWRPT